MDFNFVFLIELYLFFEKIEEVLFTFRLVSRNRVKLHSSRTNCHFKWLPTEQFTNCDVLITINYFSGVIICHFVASILRQRITIPTVQS